MNEDLRFFGKIVQKCTKKLNDEKTPLSLIPLMTYAAKSGTSIGTGTGTGTKTKGGILKGMMGGYVANLLISTGLTAVLSGENPRPMTPTEFRDVSIGFFGGEALEYGLKKAYAHMVAKVGTKAASTTMQTTAKLVAQKGLQNAGQRASQKVALQVGKMAAKQAAQASSKAGAKAMAEIGAKAAAKGSNPITAAMIAFDVVSMALDFWDPYGFNDVMDASMLDSVRRDILDMYVDALGSLPVEAGVEEGLPDRMIELVVEYFVEHRPELFEAGPGDANLLEADVEKYNYDDLDAVIEDALGGGRNGDDDGDGDVLLYGIIIGSVLMSLFLLYIYFK
jgi:hypothetical protein